MSDQEYFVYVIATKRGGRFSSPVKVGITKNLRSRLATIQTSCPNDIDIVHALTVPNKAIAEEMERCFHETQRDTRMRGEWFMLTPYEALGILCLQFMWHLDLNGVDKEIIPQIIELSGAGEEATAIINALRAQDGADA